MILQTAATPARRRPALSGVSLLVLVAFALGASVARADASLTRADGSTGRATLVETTIHHRVARPQRKQEERPSAVRRLSQARAERFDRPPAPASASAAVNLPCLRESLVALPPPAAGC